MFFILPVGVDYSARRYPVVTFTLMGLCTAIYLATFGMAASFGANHVDPWVFQYLWLIPSQSHWWTYLTSMFVHGGLLHLLGNMIYLFLFGSCVEDIIGRLRFTLFYLACGLAAEFIYIGMAPGHFASDVPMGGASGAISGCIGGFVLLLLKTRIDFKWFSFFFFRPASGNFMLPAWLVVSAWFLKDLLLAMLVTINGSSGGGVAFGAHVGGTLCGFALIAFLKACSEEIRLAGQPAVAPLTAGRRVAAAIPVVRGPAPAEPQDIYFYMDGSQIGPFTRTQVRGMFSIGSISPGTLYWKDGMTDWCAAEELSQPGSAA